MGLRTGAATLFYPIWHYELESLIVLKNNRGVDDNRARKLDYAIQINHFFYKRLLEGKNISLFSPSEVPGLYDAFFQDQALFAKLYEQYEQDESIPRNTVPAIDAFSAIMQERASTGRIYIHNVDHTNEHSAFRKEVAPIRQSNLCVAGDTKVLTTEGHVIIGENVGKKFTVWNGFEWSENVEFVQTGTNQKLYRVTVSTGQTVDATAYHKWFIYNDQGEVIKKETRELLLGDQIWNWHAPEGHEGVLFTSGVTVSNITELDGLHDTFCFTEPKRNSGIFNGILLGQCVEITLPTTPVSANEPTQGEIALCTLGGVNVGDLKSLDDLEEPLYLLVRALDNLLDYQHYPVKAAEIGAKARRSLGLGVINFAKYLVDNNTYYSDTKTGNNVTHRLFEAFQYYALKASNRLAEERGACELYEQTTYSQGSLPIDTYKKEVDTVHSQDLLLNWEELRNDIRKFGLRNSTLTAQFPAETSAVVSNSTNGVEPPRSLASVKTAKDFNVTMLVPDIKDKGLKYELLWDIPDNKGILEKMAIIQKFFDQSISTNTNYDPAKFPGNKVPMQVLLKDLIMAYRLGLKTLYYHNTRDGSGEEHGTSAGCESGACSV